MSNFAVVIPSKNIDNLLPCVEAVLQNEPDTDIIIVDDGVDFRNHIQALSRWPGTLVKGQKPFIFSRNVNQGICTAERKDVIVLNDDAILETPGGFSLLVKAAEENPQYGVIGAVTNNVGNLDQVRRNEGLRTEPRMVCFVCVCIPRRTIDMVGLLDERFIFYGMDDDDYCLQVRNAGLLIGIHDGCYVDHASLKSSYRSGPPCSFISNMKIYIKKWGKDNWGHGPETSQFKDCF